ncbi:hypothetical protein Pint_31134 [Pistacia integerrima]|uniref:Uncharacterized protein n=1 Tax=Pistacia integerrima TaxID=434235 RepID=A0ACC0XQS6_9ROSI|nr:hypothetical protein Pint_31134 [Pistacia integerrima]
MAHFSICRAVSFVFFAVVVLTAAAVTAQQSEQAAAPSPTMDAGAAVPVMLSSGLVCSSLLFSVIALLLQ